MTLYHVFTHCVPDNATWSLVQVTLNAASGSLHTLEHIAMRNCELFKIIVSQWQE